MTDWCSCNRLREAEEKAAKWDALVRCGECRYSKHDGTECWLITFSEPIPGGDEYTEAPMVVEPDDFCSWGKRREDT